VKSYHISLQFFKKIHAHVQNDFLEIGNLNPPCYWGQEVLLLTILVDAPIVNGPGDWLQIQITPQVFKKISNPF
jgi:hypothetical protein